LISPILARAQDKSAPRGPTAGQIVDVEIAQGVKMRFCFCPPGKSKLGSPKAEREAVRKAIKEEKMPGWLQAESEEVRGEFETKKGFWLAKYPMTQEEWAAVIADGDGPKRRPSSFVAGNERIKKDSITDTERFPVEMVSRVDCEVLIKKLNDGIKNGTIKEVAPMGKGKFCLPHENEWEYAARGGRGNKQVFYFGDALNGEQANCNGTFGGLPAGPNLKRTSKVGSYEEKAKHPWGLCDMIGNVCQWCENKHENPNTFVARGGSWFHDAGACRTAFRFGFAPVNGFVALGVRVCYRPD
jgi:formylglycine-generating enzyme required for sulfatase activity